EAWTQLEKSFQANERVTGTVFGRVKGGFTVDLSGAVAFLPGSQVDIRPVRDIAPLLGSPQPFQILKMDRSRGNIVVSRRAVLEESRAEQRSELVASLREGQVLTGVVKNITDYGAFVDLGGVDALLHVTDIAWRRINHPSEALSIGQSVQVQVIRFNPETQRISLGMKQLEADPGDTGEVKNITEFGLFVGLPGEIDGMVHLSDLDWQKPGEQAIAAYKKGDMVKVKVLDVDVEKERISLGIKQLTPDNFAGSAAAHKKGDVVTVTVAAINEGGVEVTLTDGAVGFIRKAELSRERSEQRPDRFAVGDKLDAKITRIDAKHHKLNLSIKAREVEEDKKALEEFGSSDSGASLGDILGAAISKAQKAKGDEEEGEAAKPKKTKAAKSKSKNEAEAE